MSKRAIITVRKSVVGDIDPIAQNMRAADRAEVWAASRRTPRRALEFSLRNSSVAFTGLADGTPFVMFGVGEQSRLLGVGVPWLLGTEQIEKHAVHFLRQSHLWSAVLQQNFRVLKNHVDNRNTLSIRWLKWLGFELAEPRPHGPDGLLFRAFEMRAENV
ncbi:MAG: hypothetical protein ABJN26_16085 [Stappiaceae bacterium]